MRILNCLEIRRLPSSPSSDDLLRQQHAYCASLLMQACRSADALFHELQAEGKLRPKDQHVCDQIVDAVSMGMRLGF